MPIHGSLMQIQSDRTVPLKKAEELAEDEVRIFSKNRQILEFFCSKRSDGESKSDSNIHYSGANASKMFIFLLPFLCNVHLNN